MSDLYTLIGEFQNYFRRYIAKKLELEILSNEQERARSFANRNKLELSSFKQLVLSNKSAFLDDFGKKAHSLPTWLDDLLEIRNKVAHYDEVSIEDKQEAIRLIGKISEFANLPTPYLVATPDTGTAGFPPKKSSKTKGSLRDPQLDRLIAEFQRLSLKRTQDEYRIYKEGSGRGSIWISKQRDGYRIVTTGVVNSLKSEIERLTSKKALTMRDRDHLWWKRMTIDEVRGVFAVLEKQ